jgi:hypothetical protein
MRPVLRLLGTRYGIALVLTVLVLVVVGFARSILAGSASSHDQVGPLVAPPSTSAAVDSSLGDDSAVEPSMSADDQPSVSPGTPNPATVAGRFITAWLKHTGVSGDQWRAGLLPNATPSLMSKLKDTDPADVPASQLTGEVQTVSRGGVVEATAPVNGGTVTLTLVVRDGRWKVDGVDWGPS